MQIIYLTRSLQSLEQMAHLQSPTPHLRLGPPRRRLGDRRARHRRRSPARNEKVRLCVSLRLRPLSHFSTISSLSDYTLPSP